MKKTIISNIVWVSILLLLICICVLLIQWIIWMWKEIYYSQFTYPQQSNHQDIIQQCDDLRMSLDNLSNLFYNSWTNEIN